MTAVEWLVQKTKLTDFWKEEIQQALEMEKQQKEKTVVNILRNNLSDDWTARWLADKIESGKINVNDL